VNPPSFAHSVGPKRRSWRAGWEVATAAAALILATGPAYAGTLPTAHPAAVGPSGAAPASAAVPAVVPFARYVAAFNSESSANQVTLGNAGAAAHVGRAVALKSALRQEAGAVVLGSGLGTFKSAPYHYKPLAVWVFALDPRGPHYQPVASLDHKPANAKYNYDVIIVRASSGTVIEEAMGWDRSLPPLPPERVVPVAPGDRHASTSCGPARRASLTADGQVAWRTALPRPHDIGTATPLAVGGTVYADSSGAVTAVNAQDGHVEWARALGQDVYGEWPVGGTLVVDVDQVGTHAKVVGLSPATGAILWQYKPGGRGLLGDPVPVGASRLAMVIPPYKVALLSASTGRLAWSAPVDAVGSPVSDGTTVAVAGVGTVKAFAAATGKLRWALTGIEPMASLTLDDGVVAVASQVTPDATPITGYDLLSGQRVWVLPLDAGSWQLSATTAGIVAAQQYPTDNGGLVLVDPLNGHIAWRSTIGRPAFLEASPVVLGSDLAMVVGRPNNGPSSLLLRSPGTGSLVANRPLRPEQAPLSFSALGADLYGTGLGSGGEPGFVEQLGPNGVTWRAGLPQPGQAPPVALHGGWIAVQTEDLQCATAF
jgi:outer membrane protein assembly factor BamB